MAKCRGMFRIDANLLEPNLENVIHVRKPDVTTDLIPRINRKGGERPLRRDQRNSIAVIASMMAACANHAANLSQFVATSALMCSGL